MLKLTLLLLSNKEMLIWSVRNHLIVIVIITCCFVIHGLNLLVLKQVCYFVMQWLPLENVESGQINLRCTWFTLTPKPEDLSPVSGHYSCHTCNWSPVSRSCVRTIQNYSSWWLVKFWKNVSGLSVLISCCVVGLPQCFKHPKDD